jgi:hypothetical protein
MDQPPPLPGPVIAAASSLWRRAGGQHWMGVEGRSMWPVLRPGDEVLVLHGGQPPRPGAIVVAREGGGLVVHRLLAVTEAGGQVTYWTQGDARPQMDAPHPAEALIGRVIARQRARRETPMPERWTARTVAALQWGARGPRRLGRLVRRAAVRLLTTLRWGW